VIPPGLRIRLTGRTTVTGVKEAHMPKGSEDLPGTIQRSPRKARETYAKTLESAHEEYGGDEERAHRTAYASLKHSFEKVGDHWEPKDHKGPSDPQAAGGRDTKRQTAGGVDVEGHSKKELLERARRLGVRGRSKMNKLELGQAIARKQD
jgi:cation transport regulator ChaB